MADPADPAAGEGGWRLSADVSRARMLRDETLIGFWTIVSPTRLSGYATRYQDAAAQHDARLAGQWRGRLAGLQHTLDAGATASRHWPAWWAIRLRPGCPPCQIAQGLEPNRGNARDGSILAPQCSAQWALGLRGQAGGAAGGQRWQAAVYRIDLHKLPMTDPLDRTALVTSGARRVQGWEASWQGRQSGWRARVQWNGQHTHNRVRTDPLQGQAFVGVAGHSLLDAGLQWQWDAVRINLKLRNALDRDHVATITALDNVYQGPRRSLWLGLGGSF